MKDDHRNFVKSVADELVVAGLVGRADHIGEHQVFFMIIKFKNSINPGSTKKCLWGVFGLSGFGTGLRGNALLHRINAFLELKFWVAIICHRQNASALRAAFMLQMNERVPYIGTQKEILEILYKSLKLPDRYVRSKHNVK